MFTAYKPFALFMIVALLLGGLISSLPVALAATPVRTTTDDNWLIGPATAGPLPSFSFVAGPGTPPLGTGSLQISIAAANSKLSLGRQGYNGLRLTDLTGLSFCGYAGPSSTNFNNFYINIYLDQDNNGTYDRRLSGTFPNLTAGNWSCHNAMGITWTLGGPGGGGSATIAAFLVTFPNAVFNYFNQPLPPILFSMGDTAATHVGFNGAIDNIVINHNVAGNGTWDFEGPVPAVVKGDDWNNLDGSNCYDGVLRRVELISLGITVQCVERLTDPSKRPTSPAGTSYVSATYVLSGFTGDQRIPNNVAWAKACFDTTGLANFHPLNVGYHYNQFDPVQIITTIPSPNSYFCVNFPGNGYLSLLSGNPTGPAPVITTSSNTASEIPLAACQIRTRAIMNLRAEPRLDATVLILVPFGEEGQLLTATAKSADGQWFKTSFGGFTGWLNVGFLTLGTGC